MLSLPYQRAIEAAIREAAAAAAREVEDTGFGTHTLASVGGMQGVRVLFSLPQPCIRQPDRGKLRFCGALHIILRQRALCSQIGFAIDAVLSKACNEGAQT